MAVTMTDVREALDPEEPNYKRAAALGPDALPHLEVLVTTAEPMLASKATYLASLIEDVRAGDVLDKAAQHADPVVRVAAAAAAVNLAGAPAGDLLRRLADDPDAGVRKVASRTRARPARGAGPAAEREGRDHARPAPARLVSGRMPGEPDEADAARAPSAMPGAGASRGGGMPGAAAAPGLMPGEQPAPASGRRGPTR
jgi:hypothetical protein